MGMQSDPGLPWDNCAPSMNRRCNSCCLFFVALRVPATQRAQSCRRTALTASSDFQNTGTCSVQSIDANPTQTMLAVHERTQLESLWDARQSHTRQRCPVTQGTYTINTVLGYDKDKCIPLDAQWSHQRRSVTQETHTINTVLRYEDKCKTS
jgi:hypothetical protein